MPTISTLSVDVEAKTSKFSTGMKVAGAAVLGLGAAAFGAFKQFEDSQKIANQTAAVIESTGGAANVTAKHVANLASALSKKTAIDDEVIQSGENMLLTFKNISNSTEEGRKVFDQATKTLIDMSTAMGTDPQQAAIQLGKALNDPVKGLTALSRVGVTFTKEQEQSIAAMVKHGNTAQAQGVILKELGSEFGGSAEAQKTASAAMSVAFGNLVETIGGLVAPAFTLLSDKAVQLAEFLQANLGPALQAVGTWLKDHAELLKNIIGPILAVIVAYKAYTTAVKIVQAVQLALNAIMAINPFVLIAAAVIAIAALIILNWGKIKKFLLDAWDAIKHAASTVWNSIKDFFARFWPVIVGIMTGGIGLVVALVIKNWDSIKEGTIKAWNAVVDFIKSIPGKIAKFFAGVGTWLYQAGRDLLSGFLNGIKSFFGTIVSTLKDWAGGIVRSVKGWLGIGSPSKVFAEIGRNIMEGLKQGLSQGGPSLLDVMDKVLSGITDKLKGRIQNIRSLMSDFASGIGGAFSGGILGAFGEDNPLSGAAIAQQVAQAKEFASLLKQLRKAGAGAGLLQEIASLGVEQGIATAQSLISQGLVSDLNKAENRIGALGLRVADQLANQIFGPRLLEAQGNLAALRPINVTIQGWVGNDQDLATKIRNELRKLGNRNAGTGL